MNRNFTTLRAAALLAAFVFCFATSMPAFAQKKQGEKGAGALTGPITNVNKADKTFAIAGRQVGVDATTIITRDGNPINFEDIKNGEQASVSTFTQADKLLAVSVKIGKVAAIVPPPTKKKK
jgi:hypothetical protein